MKKRVLLLMTSRFSIHELIILNLEKMGYEVVYKDIKPFVYKNFLQKIRNTIHKVVFNNREYKEYLIKKSTEEDIKESFPLEGDKFTYILVIRPDTYTAETISYLKKISRKVVAYQWDGFSKFKNPPELIRAFDVFGVFDKKDYKNNVEKFENLRLTQNFYFDFLEKNKEKVFDLFYVGAKEDNRYDVLSYLDELGKQNKLNNYFKLFSDKTLKHESHIIVDKMISYKQMLSLSSQAKCIIDLKNPLHSGLSFRFFEALHFNQKVITNNKTVMEVDFYNPNNILVVEDLNNLTKESLNEFLNREYVEISDEIKEKYSFENWFNTMIN